MLSKLMITILTFLPAATALAIGLFLRKMPERAVRVVSLLGALATLGLALALAATFDPRTPGWQAGWSVSAEWIPSLGISYKMGVDGLSLFLVILTALLTPIALLVSWRTPTKRVLEFHVCLLALETGVLGVFVALDLILFYVFWETVLIPMILLIGVWGSGNRIRAAVKFLVYTISGSLLMLLAIVYLAVEVEKTTGSPSFDLEAIRVALAIRPLEPGVQMALFLAFAFSFAIKVPLFPLHTWLPDAHTEAPTAGSVVLAGVLLKMGSYGFLRFAIPLFPDAALASAPWISTLAVLGIIVGAFLCMVQDDMKRLVAYSSVSHMGFVVLGIFAWNPRGIVGGVLQMVNHGLSTGALFLLVGMLYERRHTRAIADYGGLATSMPRFATAFFVVLLASIGLPGLNGFIGEFLILRGAWEESPTFAAAAALGVVLGAVYMLVLARKILFGPVIEGEHGPSGSEDLDRRELAILVPLVVLMIVIGIASPWFTDRIAPAAELWLESLGAAAR